MLDKCLGAVTINSGSGFEALLHLKPVITLGKVDYSIATKNCETAQDIAKAKDFVLKPDPEHKNFIKKFLYAHHHNRAVRTENNPYVNAVKILEGLMNLKKPFSIHYYPTLDLNFWAITKCASTTLRTYFGKFEEPYLTEKKIINEWKKNGHASLRTHLFLVEIDDLKPARNVAAIRHPIARF